MDKVDGIWIASPTSTHRQWIESVVKYKKPIYIEKPLTDTITNTEKMIELCIQHNIPLHTSWQRRLDPSFSNILNHLKKNPDWNHIRMTDFEFTHPNDNATIERMSRVGDYIKDFSCHAINFSLLLTNGEVPYKVSAIGTQCYNTGVTDHVKLTMIYRSGHPNQDRTLTIESSRFNSRMSFEVKVEVLTENRVLVAGEYVADEHQPLSWKERHASAFEAEMKHFDKILSAEDPMEVKNINPPADDIKTIKLVAALTQSLFQKRPIELDSDLMPIDENSSIRTFFLGCGFFGSWYKDIIEDSYLIKGQKDTDPYFPDPSITTPKFKILGEITALPTETKTFKRDILENDEVDAVYINTPPDMHHYQAIAALRAGKDVLTEKPVFEFKSVMEQAQASMKICMVGFHRRFDLEFNKAKAY